MELELLEPCSNQYIATTVEQPPSQGFGGAQARIQKEPRQAPHRRQGTASSWLRVPSQAVQVQVSGILQHFFSYEVGRGSLRGANSSCLLPYSRPVPPTHRHVREAGLGRSSSALNLPALICSSIDPRFVDPGWAYVSLCVVDTAPKPCSQNRVWSSLPRVARFESELGHLSVSP